MRQPGFYHTSETKAKMSVNHGRWNKGLTRDSDVRVQKQSLSLSQHWQRAPHPKGMLGKQHTQKTKQLMALHRTGSQNANWKGGITESVRLFRKSNHYQDWRRKVLEKANYICEICDLKANNAHHLKPIKQFPKLRFDPENGMALCPRCHRKIHRKESENN
jgi:hypothetical protein